MRMRSPVNDGYVIITLLLTCGLCLLGCVTSSSSSSSSSPPSPSSSSRSLSSTSSSSSSSSSSSYVPITRRFTFNVSYVNLAPDGFTRQVFSINGGVEGPVLRAKTGDRIELTVTNNLAEGISIHFHGLFQYGTNHMDGVDALTQCSIPPSVTFTYNFTTPGQWGTYMYHSHAPYNYGDGIRGVFVLERPYDGDDVTVTSGEVYKYDDDVVVSVADWYHNTTRSYFPQLYDPGEPTPDSLLIGGRANCTELPSSLCTIPTPFSVYTVNNGTVVRIRFINLSIFSLVTISIDDHEMEIIEVDGVDTKLDLVHNVTLNIAQRVSVLVNANRYRNETKDDDHGNFWIRACMFSLDYDTYPPRNMTYAILHYNDTTKIENPKTTTWPDIQYNEADLEPINQIPYVVTIPPAPTHTVTFNVSVDHHDIWRINGITWQALNYSNVLQQVLLGWNASQFPSYLNIYQIEKDAVVQLIINNPTGEHPFHLHGYNFWVLGRGDDGPYDEVIHGPLLNTKDPISRDTISVSHNGEKNTSGWLVLRFKASNPGVWFFHCHIEWHLEMGLAAIFLVDPDGIRAQYPLGWDSLPANVTSWCPKSRNITIIPPSPLPTTTSTSTVTASTSSSSSSGNVVPNPNKGDDKGGPSVKGLIAAVVILSLVVVALSLYILLRTTAGNGLLHRLGIRSSRPFTPLGVEMTGKGR
eukprot:TRINITY_DN1136_c3_g1_i1.p1 TRINITY_DN1136_c3_g1~~TRINITY_DN1136_c3_g1_i1.p1  ORF type:complete len:694 (-),score=130.20 TRINITY_DN1136_c3_g1_i1:8-2089(-)